MKYLLLVPALAAMVAAVCFWASAIVYKWPHRWQYVALVAAAVGFQFTAIWIAGYVD